MSCYNLVDINPCQLLRFVVFTNSLLLSSPISILEYPAAEVTLKATNTVGIKSFIRLFGITADLIKVSVAQEERINKWYQSLWEALNKKKLYYTQDLFFQEAMDSQSTQTIKLPILQPCEYDLWKMRMEEYLQCIDYTLWEIVENASSTEVIEQTYERLQKIISQLEMHGEVIPEEDINQKRDRFEVEHCYADYEAKRFLKNTRRKLDMANKERIGFDKVKVECIQTVIKEDNFARDSTHPGIQRQQKQGAYKKIVPVDKQLQKMLSIIVVMALAIME
ncbi:hypothetical protein Tco_1343626 [Tanacetum coccineum]